MVRVKRDSLFMIFVGVLCLFMGYAINSEVTKFKSSDSSNMESEVNMGNTLMDGNTSIELRSIIYNYLSFLYSKSNYKDISNQDRLVIVTETNGDTFNNTNEFSVDTLRSTYAKSIFSNSKYSDEDIGASHNGVIMDGVVKWKFDSSRGMYVYNGVDVSKNGTRVLYTYPVNSYMDGDRYVIVNRYLFVNSYGDSDIEGDRVIYGSFREANSNIGTFDRGSDGIGKVSKVVLGNYGLVQDFVNDNYGEFMDKMDTYTYVFEKDKEDGHFVLADYWVDFGK